MRYIKNNSVRILIAEWIPSLNKGELAILIGMLKTFELLGKVEVSILSFYPSVDKERYPKNVKIIDARNNLYLRNSLIEGSIFDKVSSYILSAFLHILFTLLSIIFGKNALKIMNKPIWKEYYQSDVIIICHDQINCVSGFILLFSPLYITFLAKSLRKPIIIYANGTNSFGRKIWEIMATYVLNNVDLITTREEESFLYLNRFIWNKARIYLTRDPAILMPSVSPQKVRDIMWEEKINKNDKLLIGVALSREVLLNAFPKYKNLNLSYKMAKLEIAKLLDRLIENFQATIAFIPHCIEPYNNRDDRIVAKEIYNIMKNKSKTWILVKERSPEELKGLMGQLDLLITTRAHAATNALSMGVPSCTITRLSDKRAYSLIGKMLKQEKWIYNVENLNANIFFTQIVDLLSSSDQVRKELPPIISSAKEKALLNGKLLKALLDSRLKSKT